MTLEQNCASLELAKKLEKAGYPQKGSLFYWQTYGGKTGYVLSYKDDLLGAKEVVNTAAPTCAEIGEKLPRCYMSWSTPQNGDMKWWCRVNEQHMVEHKDRKITTAEKEVDARAKMYLYLKK